MIPDYIDCNSKYITACDYFMIPDCPNTCGLAKQIGVGAGDPETQKRITKELVDKLFEEDMNDY